MLRIGICDDSADARIALRAALERALERRRSGADTSFFEFSSGEGLLRWLGSHAGELDLALKERLPECFVEFRPYLADCRFVGCSHTKEKGCAVLKAVKAGAIPRSRHESYVRLCKELKDLRAWNGRSAGKQV